MVISQFNYKLQVKSHGLTSQAEEKVAIEPKDLSFCQVRTTGYVALGWNPKKITSLVAEREPRKRFEKKKVRYHLTHLTKCLPWFTKWYDISFDWVQDARVDPPCCFKRACSASERSTLDLLLPKVLHSLTGDSIDSTTSKDVLKGMAIKTWRFVGKWHPNCLGTKQPNPVPFQVFKWLTARVFPCAGLEAPTRSGCSREQCQSRSCIQRQTRPCEQRPQTALHPKKLYTKTLKPKRG